MEKLYFKEAIIVEGKYDKIKLSSFIDSTIIQTDGFRLFKDKQKSDMIRALAQKNGIIIATDSDVAGFKIRSYIKSITKNANIKNVYIPQIIGKEKRKAVASKENTLGVEGININILKEIFGAVTDCTEEKSQARQITKIDFVQDGLSGGQESKQKRLKLLSHLGLPQYLSTNALLDVINQFLSYEEYKNIIS